MTERRITHPGEYAYSEEDTPTKPDNGDPDALAMARLYGDLNAWERRKVVSLLKAWSKCSLDQRVLIEAVAREFAPADS